MGPEARFDGHAEPDGNIDRFYNKLRSGVPNGRFSLLLSLVPDSRNDAIISAKKQWAI
jgi:hypothetical protein